MLIVVSMSAMRTGGQASACGLSFGRSGNGTIITSLKKIIDHPDKDEIISKLVIGISPKDVHDWLEAKYTNVSETKFVIAEKSIKSFQENYLDIYNLIQEEQEQKQENLKRVQDITDVLGSQI